MGNFMRKVIFICLINLFLIVIYLPAEMISNNVFKNQNMPAHVGDFQQLRNMNQLLPGYGQWMMGNTWEGLLTSFALPLYVCGSYFLADGFVSGLKSGHYQWNVNDGTNYFFIKSASVNPDRWKITLGTSLGIWGMFLWVYSGYALERDYAKLYPGNYREYLNSEGLTNEGYFAPRQELSDLLLAPYRPDNLFSSEVLPVLGLLILPYLNSDVFYRVSQYFQRSKVNFFGAQVSPWAGLGFALLTSVAIVTANATWEEIYFRDSMLRSSGLEVSSFAFGSAHLGNIIYPDRSVSETILQTFSATAFGYYAAFVTKNNHYNIQKAISMHFWNNVLINTLNYLIDPENGFYFTIEFPIYF